MPPPADGFASRVFLGPALRTQPDRRLVTLVHEGYEAAFEEIVRRYGRPLTRYAAAIVGSRSEDVTQDAFSKALLALRRDDAEIELRPWLFRIVRNTALNDLRDSPPSPEVLAEAIAGGRNPAEELEQREELADLMVRLQALPEAQRAAIVMRELEGLSHEEIASALGMSGGGARQAIYRARRALRDGLGMLIPLPLIQSMLSGAAPGVAETAVGAAGVGGAGVALKATAATVLVAGAVGAGVALKDNPHSDDAKAAPVRVEQSGASESASSTPPRPVADDGDSGESQSGSGDDDRGHGRGEAERGDDRGGHGGRGGEGENEPGDDHGGAREPADDHGEAPGDDRGGPSGPSGHGGSSGRGGDDRSGSSGGGGSGSGRGGSGSGDGEHSGSGSSHSGSGSNGGSSSGDDGSSHSGSGSGGEENPSPNEGSGDSDPAPSEEPPPDDSSGPGSGDLRDLGDDDGLSG